MSFIISNHPLTIQRGALDICQKHQNHQNHQNTRTKL